MFSIDYIKEWSESYKTDLTTNIMPFWLKYGLDKVNGGIYTCVDRDGSLMDTTKSVWFQGRFAFICSFTPKGISFMEKEMINRLKIVLAEEQKSSKWLAEQLGKDRATVSKWVTNTMQPDARNLLRIAEALNIDAGRLLNQKHLKK